jgi:hypothetical protein
MASSWQEYQEEAAAFFRSLGLDAETDIRHRGVRTSHDVDVLVKSHHAGFDITWIVECKFWRTPVSKLHVLALREIVTDVGTDRGILLSESGFQSGAIEAAALTNVQLTSLAAVRSSASTDILSMRLRDLYDRNESCKDRYWNIPKETRIEHGLRMDVGDWGYSAARVIEYVSDILSRAFRGQYPIRGVTPVATLRLNVHRQFEGPAEVVEHLEPLTADLESRLSACESTIAPRRSDA